MRTHHHHHVEGKNLALTIFLNVIITLLQIIGGIVSGSIALLSDALHNFSDVASLLISYVANRLARRAATDEKTYGMHRAEILAALVNASVLIGVAFFLIIEALGRLMEPEVIASIWVIVLAAGGILLNGVSAWLLHQDAQSNINIRSSYLHLLTDTMTSVSVLFGGLIMYFFEIYWIDAVLGILIGIYLIISASGILKESVRIFMQYAPPSIDLAEAQKAITAFDGVNGVHHLHLWQLDDHGIHFEGHIEFDEDIRLSSAAEINEAISAMLYERFGITHTTLQSEYNTQHSRVRLGC